MIWNCLFSPNSFCDKGTLKQLVNLINRPKITSKVKQNFTAVQDFFSVILDSHITAAALHLFGMKSPTDEPTLHCFEGDLQHTTSEASKCVDTIVTRFVLNKVQTLENENSISQDGVFEYSYSVIRLGLMARNFSDAIHEEW